MLASRPRKLWERARADLLLWQRNGGRKVRALLTKNYCLRFRKYEMQRTPQSQRIVAEQKWRRQQEQQSGMRTANIFSILVITKACKEASSPMSGSGLSDDKYSICGACKLTVVTPPEKHARDTEGFYHHDKTLKFPHDSCTFLTSLSQHHTSRLRTYSRRIWCLPNWPLTLATPIRPPSTPRHHLTLLRRHKSQPSRILFLPIKSLPAAHASDLACLIMELSDNCLCTGLELP
jgi:hypothetical protein